MSELKKTINKLRRPKLLVRAARIGALNYRRDRDLTHILRKQTSAKNALAALVASESELEQTRKSGDSTYSIQRHVGVLIALIAEARLTGLARPV